jgi:hypothetical protein
MTKISPIEERTNRFRLLVDMGIYYNIMNWNLDFIKSCYNYEKFKFNKPSKFQFIIHKLSKDFYV